MKLDKVIYTAEVDTVGGRSGRAVSSDKRLDVKFELPKALGGAGGEGTNPEQLFAAGYSACFLSALKAVAAQKKIQLPEDTAIHASVSIGMGVGGYGLAVELKITIPGLERETALPLVDEAHQMCPYSKATRNNIDVTITLL